MDPRHGRPSVPVWLALLGLAAAVAAGGVALASCNGNETIEGPPPNLLLIVVDTLRADHTSAYGYHRDTTPHLLRLGEDGLRFDAAYAPSATTAPSHASLFTGRYLGGHGVSKNGIPLSPEQATLAERLRDAGYTTGAVVSSFVLDRKFGFAQGFDVYEDDFDPAEATLRADHWEGERVEAFDRRATLTTDRALRWLNEAPSPGRPWFLFVHYFDPHDPYVAPAEWRRRFPPEAPAGRNERARALYDAEVAYTDSEIGRLLQGLETLEIAADTLVVVTADHGEGLFDHDFLYHNIHLYEEAVRVPLLFRWPGRLTGDRVVHEPVSLVDVAPTLLELAGIEAIGDSDGQSLADVLRGRAEPDADRPIFLERCAFETTHVADIPVKGDKLAVRLGAWKYIEAPEEGSSELFLLESDPQEQHNLAEGQPERVRDLSRRLRELRIDRDTQSPLHVDPKDRRRLEALGYTQ